MTPMEQALSSVSEGKDAGDTSSHAGRRRVRSAPGLQPKSNDSSAPGSETLQKRIEVLFEAGLSDAEIAERLGCKTPYVRVARQRAGLFRAPVSQQRSRQSEAELIARIDRIQGQLTKAWSDLRAWRERQPKQS